MASSSTTDLQEQIEQFKLVTGATDEVAMQLLEACRGNLEVAIGMHVDNEAAHENRNRAEQPPLPDDGDNVRAPIPQMRDVLVGHDAPIFAFRGRRFQARSVFDRFRDFRREAEQSVGASSEGSSALNNRRRTLEDLFRPPLEIMHRGSFASARAQGTIENRWLMVNVQNVREFACQALNRDVWSDDNVRQLIEPHFVFWQVYFDSDEGQKYNQFYKVENWPYVAVLDPRTGEKILTWNKLDAATFITLASKFLAEHPSPNGNEHVSDDEVEPAAKRKRTESGIVDGSEDQQLEAAIKASLAKPRPSIIDISDDENELETFSTDNEASSLPPSPRSSPGGRVSSSDDEEPRVPRIASPPNSSGESSSVEIIENHVQMKWTDFLGSDTDEKLQLLLRFPDGKREQISVPTSSKLKALFLFVEERGIAADSFDLVTNYPKRSLSEQGLERTLSDVGLCSRETLFVEIR